MTAHEAARRLEKAIVLADTIAWTVRLTLGKSELPSEIAEHLDDMAWRLVAKKAGTRKPSEQTRELAIKILQDREALARELPTDPFDGIPTEANPSGRRVS